jgi:phosphocarrier protein
MAFSPVRLHVRTEAADPPRRLSRPAHTRPPSAASAKAAAFTIDNDSANPMIRTELEIINRLGLHARAAAKFVTCASGFDSAVQVERDGRRVNGKSIMGVMMLAAACGTSIIVEVDGDDEEAATAALAALVRDRFAEGE